MFLAHCKRELNSSFLMQKNLVSFTVIKYTLPMEILRTSFDTRYRLHVLQVSIFVYRDCPSRPVFVIKKGEGYVSKSITRSEAANLLLMARAVSKL